MKKVFVLMLAVMMCLMAFAGCGSKEPAASDAGSPEKGAQAEEKEPAKAEVSGEVFDAGNVSALVPSGWKAFPVADIFSDEEDATDPDVIQIGKGAESEWDLFSKPYVQINYYGPDTDMMEPMKDLYDDAEDIDPITAGDYTWTGFTGVSFESKLAILWTEDGDHQYQATIWLEMDGGTISISDADVQAILASVKPSA